MQTLPPHPRTLSPQGRGGHYGWLVLFALGGYLLFAHGCHGDEDNELLASAGRRPAVAHGRGIGQGTGLEKRSVLGPSLAANLRFASTR